MNNRTHPIEREKNPPSSPFSSFVNLKAKKPVACSIACLLGECKGENGGKCENVGGGGCGKEGGWTAEDEVGGYGEV